MLRICSISHYEFIYDLQLAIMLENKEA